MSGTRQPDRLARLTPALPIILSLLPLLLLVVFCINEHVDVPFGDQWELVPRLDHLDAGQLSFHDLWRQHNEHRPMFPIAIMLVLAWITDWNIGAEVAVNVALGAAIFCVYAAALKRMRPDAPWRWWLLPIVSLLAASLVQWENWLWGWQIQILLGVLASTTGLWLLSTGDPRGRRFWWALACGVIATYSFSSGLTYWIVGAVPLVLNRDQRRRSRAAAWVAVAGATITSYFIGYSLPPNHPPLIDNFRSAGATLHLGIYVLKYLGGLVSGYMLNGRLAAVTGAVAFAVFTWLVGRNWSARTDPAFIFPVAIGLNTLADAAMTSLGRTGFGTNQALASRYTTIAEPLWIAILLLVVLDLARRGGPSTMSMPARLVCAGATAGFVLCSSIAAVQGAHAAAERMGHLRALRTMLRDGVNWPAVATLYIGDVPTIRQRAGQLKMLRMSVFRE
jgi:hypothetical protein